MYDMNQQSCEVVRKKGQGKGVQITRVMRMRMVGVDDEDEDEDDNVHNSEGEEGGRDRDIQSG
jgi:hypothetical protein